MSEFDDWDPFDGASDQPKARASGHYSGKKKDEGHDVAKVEVINETGKAILVRGKGLSSDPFGVEDENEEAWIPISQLHTRSEVRHTGDVGLLVISTWLAEQKGLA
jgi:hypothetical protein